MLEIGALVDNRYVVISVLGEGGMARVYKVRHAALDSFHALKVLIPEMVQNPEIRQRFLAEGKLLARLRHPNIVAVTDVVVSPVAGLVMDFLDGETLADYLVRVPGPMDPETLLLVFEQVLDAVGYAHLKGVVHRDLKPSNIFLESADGRFAVKVLDFGIAKVDGDATLRGKTRTGAKMGTPQYMSPEQIRGAKDVTVRSDIFALGTILHEMATGKVCFDAESDFDIQLQIVNGTFARPSTINPNLGPGLDAIIMKALATDPEQRFASCDELAAALRTPVPVHGVDETTEPVPIAPPSRRVTPPDAEATPPRPPPKTKVTPPPPAPEAPPRRPEPEPEPDPVPLVELPPERSFWGRVAGIFIEPAPKPAPPVEPRPVSRTAPTQPPSSTPAPPRTQPPSRPQPPPKTQFPQGPRFLLSADGQTVHDQRTGLIWLRQVPRFRLNWQAARSFAQALDVAGGGWRLPTKDELESIVLRSVSPSINREAFPETPSEWFWTSTVYHSGMVWAISFEHGTVSDLLASSEYRIRCVRSRGPG